MVDGIRRRWPSTSTLFHLSILSLSIALTSKTANSKEGGLVLTSILLPNPMLNGPATDHDGSAIGTEQRIRDIIYNESGGCIIDSSDDMKKRLNYLSWDDYFLGIAYLSSRRSKDPHPSNGACIVDNRGRIVGIGYDGFPRDCSDDCLPWAISSTPTNDEGGFEGRDDNGKLPWLHKKDPYLCHAEINAILNKCSNDVEGGRMFVPNFPSNECAKFIVQSGIKEIVYVKDITPNSNSSRASRILFNVAGVKMTKMTPTVPFIPISLDPTKRHVNEDAGTPNQYSNRRRDEAIMEKYLGLVLREANFNPFEAKTQKRMDYLTWDDYFMAVAYLSAMRSKDPNTQVGACIVDAQKCIIGIGYNGFPRGCSDDHLPWARTGDNPLLTKYPYVVHAEVNAILNKCGANVRGATIYVALFPCNECSKVIIQSGIREVVYLNDFYHDTDSSRASRIMFQMAGVSLRQHRPDCGDIVIDFRKDLE